MIRVIVDKGTPKPTFLWVWPSLVVSQRIDRDVDEGLSFFFSNVDAIVDDVEAITLRAVVMANAHVWESSLRVATNTSTSTPSTWV
jgi:hypothetical protein